MGIGACSHGPKQIEIPLESIVSNDYALEGPLGRGGFGDVYRVRSTKTNEIYAAKYILLDMVCKLMKFTQDYALNMIKNEIENMKKCKEIKEVVRFSDLSIKENIVIIYMEYCPDGTLDDLINTEYQHGIPNHLLKLILKQVVKGISQLHSLRIIHHDIKLNNIFIFNKKELIIKIGDLGLSVNLPNSRSFASFSTRVGCTDYISPEEYYRSDNNNESLDHRPSNTLKDYNQIDDDKKDSYHIGYKSDIYAFGITLINLCFGKQRIFHERFRSDIKHDYLKEITRKYKSTTSISKNLFDIISGSIECDYTRRFMIYQIQYHNYFLEESTTISTQLKLKERIDEVMSSHQHYDVFIKQNRRIHESIMKCADGGTYMDMREMKSKIDEYDFVDVVVSILSMFSHITKLNISNCGITDEFISKFCGVMKFLPKLEILWVQGNFIGVEGFIPLSFNFDRMTDLTELSLEDNNLGDYGLSCLSNSLIIIPKLSILRLNSNNISHIGVGHLSTHLKYLPNLLKLSLGSNNISGPEFVRFSNSLKFVSNLTHLWLYECHLDDSDARNLVVNFKCLTLLEYVSLSGNNISDAGIWFISQDFKYLKKLTELYLCKNPSERFRDVEWSTNCIDLMKQ